MGENCVWIAIIYSENKCDVNWDEAVEEERLGVAALIR